MREDGRETRNRLLEAACELFSKKGYHKATVAEICKRAGVNVAAVNYYFHDKASLYVEAWKHAFEKYPWPELSDSSTSPEEQLRALINYLIRKFTDQGYQGQFARLYMMELLNPTGLVRKCWHELIEPRRRTLLEIIRKVMGKKTVDEDVLLCELSIVNQCRVLLTVRPCDLEYLLDQPITPGFLEKLASHIAEFSLAGMKAIGRKEHI